MAMSESLSKHLFGFPTEKWKKKKKKQKTLALSVLLLGKSAALSYPSVVSPQTSPVIADFSC